MDVLGSIGGRGSVEHAEAVKDFYVLLMNLRFSGLDELSAQIGKDADAARQRLQATAG